MKRIIDIVLSTILLIVFSPVFLCIAVSIKFRSGGPILYTWKAVGKDGSPFKSWKFCTMIERADQEKGKLYSQNEMSGPVFKMKNDPRITSLGKFLRKYSLDELPQLWSVFKGDMSLVGPRPAESQEWEQYQEWQKRKLSVIPGMTCLWQVNGRNEISDFDEWVRMDLEYIDNWSLWLDIKILFKTIPVVLKGTGR